MTIASPQREENAVSRRLVDAGEHYIGPVDAGQTLRIVDVDGNEAADTLFFNRHDPAERYSCMDTVREQGNVYLTTGSALRSNLNRVMLTITADTVGRHDTLGGACASESNTVRYDLEKRHMHSCRDNWMLAISKAMSSLSVDRRDRAQRPACHAGSLSRRRRPAFDASPGSYQDSAWPRRGSAPSSLSIGCGRH